MNIEFQHANPHSGRESLLLRIDGLLANQTVCVLVDAGRNVSVGDLLDEDDDEHLAAICLTHAHLDHYQSLGQNLQDGAPVYAASDTARILADVFAAGVDHYELRRTDTVLDRLESVDGWTQIVPGLRVHPVPAGHAPGGAGFCFEVEDGDARRTILVTGDFTTRRAGGYPGFEVDLPVNVDVLALTAASNERFESSLTDALATVYERAHAGSTVLVTASGLTGLQVAYLLGHLVAERGDSLPVTVAGHVAKLYDRLEYAVPNVESVPEFDDPAGVLTAGGVTIAGPEVPIEGSGERLFEPIADDPGATLVQLLSGPHAPKTGVGCTAHHFRLSNHPTPETIDSVVEALSPVHVIVTHQEGPAADRYKDRYCSFVWATDDTARYTLLDDTGWTPPPWVTERTTRRVRAGTSTTGPVLGDVAVDELTLPAVTRHEDADLEAEGIDLAAIQERLPSQPGGQPIDRRPRADRPGGQPVDESMSDGGVTTFSEIAADAEAGSGLGVDEDTETTLETIDARLDRLEAALADPTASHDAHVVDAGDGTIFLRLEEPPDRLEHGQRLCVDIRDENALESGADATADDLESA